jgi:hypothetical protein
MTTAFQLVNSIPSTYDPNTPGICYEGDHYVAQLSARDPEMQTVAYYLLDGSLPLGMELDPSSGIISGIASLASLVPGANSGRADHYNWTFSVGASDGANNPEDDLQEFTITIKHIPLPPVFAAGSGGILFSLYEAGNTQGPTIDNSTGIEISIAGPIVNNTVSIVSVSGGLQMNANGITDSQTPPLPITYTVLSGSLPLGITLTSDGLFQGSLPPLRSSDPSVDNYVPLNGSEFPFVLQASNGFKNASINCQINLVNVIQVPRWTTSSGNIGTFPQLSPMSFQLQAVDVDGLPITYTLISGGFESGVTMNSSGRISGTPFNPVQGSDNTTSFTVSASNGTYSTNQTFSITFQNVNVPPTWVTPAGELGSQYGGSFFSDTVVATSLQGYGITYTLAGGSLPPGISLSSSGTISGVLPVVTPGHVYNFVINASDPNFSVGQSFSIEVLQLPNQAPVWQTGSGSLGSGYGGTGFAFQLSAYDPDNGPNSLSFFLAGGGLPAGLFLTGSGYIGGTFGAVGGNTVYNFTVGVTDGSAQVNQGFSITALAAGSGQADYAQNDTFVVPAGVFHLNFDWIIGGGASGGAGQQQGNGGGGGGGGGGGWYQNYGLAVNPGDVISIFVGAPGPSTGQLSNGQNGGDTFLQINGNEFVRATGGVGGQLSTNGAGTFNPAPGGPGGSPNGTPGGAGPPGTSDSASGSGADGGGGPMPGSFGGHGGGIGQNGGDGSGFGSGGGGGGFHDRTAPQFWYGGNGIVGYVQISW